MSHFQESGPPTDKKNPNMPMWPVRFIDPCPPNQIEFSRMVNIRVFPDPAAQSCPHLYGCHPFNGNAGSLCGQINVPAAINAFLL
jgi:hypothetical protein